MDLLPLRLCLGELEHGLGCYHSNSGYDYSCDYYFPSGMCIIVYLFIYWKNDKIILRGSQHSHCVGIPGGRDGAILNLWEIVWVLEKETEKPQ